MKSMKLKSDTIPSEQNASLSSTDAGQQDELREDFEYCDANRDGYLQYAEFMALLDNLDAGMSGEEIRIGFHEIDTNHDGLIDFPEFIGWWTDR